MRLLLFRLQAGWSLWEALRSPLLVWWRNLTTRPKEEHAGPWRTFQARCTLCGMACQLVVPADQVVVRTRWECARCLQIAMAEVRE